MSRLIFEDDDVIREALMMDSDTDDDCNVVNKQRISSKENTNESTVQQMKINVDEELKNKDMEEKNNSETCQNCLQEFEKKELQNHDCGKKKRKSLVLSFHSNLSITSSLNVKGSRKSDIKNDTAKSDKRRSIDSSTSEKIGKNNHEKSSEHDKNYDHDVKEQNVKIKKSKTLIFYECPACFQHFTKKEFDIHNCRDSSPCLTLKFSTRSSFDDSVDKYDRNKSKRAKSEDFLKTNVKSFIHKEKAQVKRKRDNSMPLPTDLKQPIKSQHSENEKDLKKYNQPIALKNDTKRTKIMKRKSPDIDKGTEEKVCAPKTKNIKLDNQNNVINQSVSTISEGSVGDVNKIVAIETSSQKSTTETKDQSNDEKDAAKNENFDHSETVDPKSIPQIENNTISGNEKSKVQPNQVATSSNTKPNNKIEECKSIEKSGIIVSHKIDTELKQTVLNKRILRSAKKNVNSQTEQKKQEKKIDILPKQDKISSQSTDKMSKRGEKSSKNGNPETQKIYRMNKRKVLLENEGTENRNLVNKNVEAVTIRNEEDGEDENLNKQKKAKQIVIKSQSEERKKDNKCNKILKESKISSQSHDIVTDKMSENCITESKNTNNKKMAEGNRNFENVKPSVTLNEKNNDTEQEKSIKIDFRQDNTKTGIIKKTKRLSLQNKYKCRLCYAKYTKFKHYNHICKYKAKKTKSKKIKRQIVKQSDAIMKNCKNNSQSKINITILSRENVKIVTVSNNAKDYEVNQGDISNYVHSNQMSKQNEIKETTEQIHKSATETVSQSELINISEDKSFEREKVTFDVTGKAELITSQHRNADGKKSDITSKAFSICEENSKIQVNDAPRVEPPKQNKNEKQITKILHNNSNPTEIENIILSQNSDHSYSITDVENNLSINTVDIEHTVSTRDVEHNYSVIEENMISTYKIDDMISKTTKNSTIVTENERAINKTKLNTTKNKENETMTTENQITNSENKEKEIILNENQLSSSENKEKESIRTINKITATEHKRTTTKYEENRLSELTNIHSEITTSENVGREVTIPEGEESEITELETEITTTECKMNLPEDVESEVTVPESAKNEISVPESEITISECVTILPESVGSLITLPDSMGSQITVTTQNENTISTKNIDIENLTNQTGSTDCEIVISNDNVENEVIIATQNEGIDNNELTLNDNTISVDDVAQEIIISASEDCEESEIVTADVENHVSITTQMKDDSFVSIEKVAHEVMTNENIETDDVSTENIGSLIVITERDENVTNISTQNNVLVENIKNAIVEVSESNQDQPTVNIDNGNNVLVQNEFSISVEKEGGILPSQSGQSEKNIPTNDEIETIIIISSEDENKKNIVLTQNEKNETVIIISKQKDVISGDHNTVPSRIEEITVRDHQIKKLVDNNKLSLTEQKDIKAKNDYKCSKCSKTYTKDELKTHNCTEKGKEKIKKGKITKFKFRNQKKLHKKGLNSHKCGEKIGVREKEESSSIETEKDTILNQTDSQNKILKTQESFSNPPGNHKCDENNKDKGDITLESQLAAILNQNESQNKMAVTHDHSRSFSVNNIKNDNSTDEGNLSPITKNQLLDILSKNVNDTSSVENFTKINHDTVQKENSTKTKCFRCSKEFTDRELTTHNCLKKSRKTDQNSDKIENITTEVAESRQNNDAAENNVLYVIKIKENLEPEEKLCTDHKIPKSKYIRCFICSEIYDKTHKCSNNENVQITENNNISLEKPDINNQDESRPENSKLKKKNKYYFDTYILRTKHGAYQCKICKKEYTARKNLVRHIHQHEKDYNKERFKCGLCFKKFQYRASLKSHEACHTGETHACNFCDKSFSRKTNLYTHIKLHLDEKFPCNKCGKEYTSKKCLNNHPCFNTKEYFCNFCDKKYKQKSNLIDHLHTHAGVKPYECEFCNNKYAFRATYLIHKQNCAVAKKQDHEKTVKHNKNSQLSCKFCSITLKNKSQLQKHEWRHENKHFFCNICSKKFNSKHFLQLHLASHEESGVVRKKFDCPHCEKNFSTKFGLKLHLNLHSGVTFPCPLCEKLFTTKLLLKTHEKTHTGQTPFVCDNCKKAFNNRSNYNRHKKNKVCFFIPIETSDEQ